MGFLNSSKRTDVASIEFTSRCNLRCVYCGSLHPGYVAKDLDLATFEQLLHDLKKRRVQRILANGHGETTMVKDWHIYCGRLMDEGFTLHLITNLSKNYASDEIKILARFNQLEISCDTANPELHAELRKGSRLEVLLDNMKAIRAEGSPHISWSCVVSDRNVFSLPEYVRLGVSNGVQHFSFCNLVEYEGCPVQHVSKVDDPQRAIASIEESLDLLRREGVHFSIMEAICESLKGKTSHSLQRHFTRIGSGQTRDCTDPWTFTQIKSTGDILPCCNPIPVGSLSESSIDDILNGQRISALRTGLLSGKLDQKCRECHAKGVTSTARLKRKIAMSKILGVFRK